MIKKIGKKKRTNPFSTSGMGVCLKTPNQIVEYQNDVCKRVCGKKDGKKCEDGCMKGFRRAKVDADFEKGIVFLNQIDSDGKKIDAVVVNDGRSILTVFLECEKSKSKLIAKLERYGLTDSEKKILNLVMMGFSNRKISGDFCVSLQTIRTHLNNIYKKIPQPTLDDLLLTHPNRCGNKKR